MTSGYPAFPEDPVASAVFDAYPPPGTNLDDLSVEELRAVSEWHVANLAADPMCEDVLELVEERLDDPLLVVDFPEHNVTPEEELDALDVP